MYAWTEEQMDGQGDILLDHMAKLIIIIINEFHRDASLKENFRVAVCHVLH